MPAWVRKRILIWGKTRPELSRSHREIVCTGGVCEDTRKFIRLYPIPQRYFDDERVFKKYQWIEADVRKSARDVRPESYNIRFDSIRLGERIPTRRGDWTKRAEWIMQPHNIFPSLEALQQARKSTGTSIGMVRPLSILDVHADPYPSQEKAAFWRKYREIESQQELPFGPDEKDRQVKPLSPPDFRFKIKFRCDDSACEHDHDIGVYDWEADALYFRCIQRGDSQEQACNNVLAKLRDEACGLDRDTYFFLGNLASHPDVFIIGGLWYPKKRPVIQDTLY